MEMLQRSQTGLRLEALKPCISLDQVRQIQEQCLEVKVERSLQQYILNLVRATREDSDIRLGVSPRGTVTLQRAAQALAFLSHRDYVLPDDIKRLAPYVLSHRMIPSGGQPPQRIIERLLKSIPIP
jgi:MoxR-like ATPase